MTGGPVCTVGECEQEGRAARGLCWTHYQRLRRTGSLYRRADPRYDGAPAGVRLDGPRPATVEEKFWSHTTRTPGGCWEWAGPRRKDGSPCFTFGRRSYSAHRYSWTLFVDPHLNRMEIITWPGDCRCVNPQHLEALYIGDVIRAGHAGTWTKRTPV